MEIPVIRFGLMVYYKKITRFHVISSFSKLKITNPSEVLV